METILTYRGREVTGDDVALIRRLIEEHPEDGRCALSRRLCELWDWRQPNGQLKAMICRGLFLQLERRGHLTLPPPKSTPPKNPFVHRCRPQPVELDQTPIETTLKALAPVRFAQVRRTSDEKVFNGIIETHHYLGYAQPVGEHLKYLVFSADRPIACFAWSSAAWHMNARDRYIGWSPEVRKKNLRLLAYNTRFLILPWVRVKHLASHLLGRCARRISNDWQALYHHPIHWLETCVDTGRFEGTSYRAANWIYLGKSSGRGMNDRRNRPRRTIKAIYGYPLSPDFRRRLCHG